MKIMKMVYRSNSHSMENRRKSFLWKTGVSQLQQQIQLLQKQWQEYQQADQTQILFLHSMYNKTDRQQYQQQTLQNKGLQELLALWKSEQQKLQLLEHVSADCDVKEPACQVPVCTKCQHVPSAAELMQRTQLHPNAI